MGKVVLMDCKIGQFDPEQAKKDFKCSIKSIGKARTEGNFRTY